MRIVRYPVVIVRQGDRILLGLNKRGFSKNKWTLFGGFVQRKEILQNAALRTLKEQCGLTADKIEKVGKVEMKFAGTQELVQANIYITEDFTGDLTETKDMQPQWFRLKELPVKDMWADVPFWLGPALSGNRVKGFFIYENETLLYQEMEVAPLLARTTQ